MTVDPCDTTHLSFCPVGFGDDNKDDNGAAGGTGTGLNGGSSAKAPSIVSSSGAVAVGRKVKCALECRKVVECPPGKGMKGAMDTAKSLWGKAKSLALKGKADPDKVRRETKRVEERRNGTKRDGERVALRVPWYHGTRVLDMYGCMCREMALFGRAQTLFSPSTSTEY